MSGYGYRGASRYGRGLGSFAKIPADVKQGIIALGADRAVVTFWGENDEGGAERVRFFKGDELVCERHAEHEDDDGYEWDAKSQSWVEVEKPDTPDRTVSWLCGVVDERYGGYGGEGSVHGTLTATPATDELRWDVNQEMPHHSSWTE